MIPYRNLHETIWTVTASHRNMGEPVDPNLDEITAANRRALERARDIVGDLKAVVEHEVLLDESISRSIEINPPLPPRK